MITARHAARGFTLIELVLVIGLFGLMSVMAYGGLRSVLTARESVEASLENLSKVQRAYWRLREDLQQLSPRPAKNQFGQAEAALATELDGLMQFSRAGRRNPLFAPRPGIERVEYRLEEDRFLRRSWRAVDRAPNAEPWEATLMEDVRELSWRFLDDAGSWHDSWPPQSNAGTPNLEMLPRAVEMTLDSRDLGELVWLFRGGVGS